MIKKIIRRLKSILYNKKNLVVGKNTRILTSYQNFGSEPYLIIIGNNCTITSGVKFITHDATIEVALNYLKIKRITLKGKYEKMGGIRIKDNCVIGINSIILPNVTIGPNSIVGAGSVVSKNVPPNTVVAGNPAKVICSIDDYSNKLMDKLTIIPDHSKNTIMKLIKIPK
ncbi:acyltransferase [Sunxiuqinia dokdonensis]|uniref:Acyltransferase n=1 Tax=Sunxiuqinia dokdonensis TaxID=1409788 RepID=A0A0L8VF62_9BACT|nr:acyltransferase [Sunxiuqinia dokdonensis]KOH47099.1 hypothetical protein NC99_00650 [Sunxiuqinia dokdonensis]